MAVSAKLLALLGIDTSNEQDDVIFGDDFLLGALAGGDGNDYVEGMGGIDLLTGGTGSDTVGYSESDVGVNINLGNLLLGLLGAYGGDADGDVLVNGFENVVGSAHADDITGDAGANILVGLEDADRLDGSGGDDTLIGGIGADALIGDTGSDTASYALATAGVAVSLSTGTGTAGEAAGDTLTGIENLTGSDFADVLEGNALTNHIQAGAGDDTIIGTDGLDVIDGGAGNDTLDFSANTTGVNIDFGTGRFISVEGIVGGSGGDTINLAAPQTEGAAALAVAAEDTAGASVDGGDGDDTIAGSDNDDDEDGGDGDDTLDGGGGNDNIDGGAGHDAMNGGAGNDSFNYSDGADDVIGGDGDDTYVVATGAILNPTGVGDMAAAASEIDGGTFDAGSGHDILDFPTISAPDEDFTAKQLHDLTMVITPLSVDESGFAPAADVDAPRAHVSVATPDVSWGVDVDSDAWNVALSGLQTAAEAPASSMTLAGTDQDDVITNETDLAWTLDGGGGNDTFTGGIGSEIFIGGAGADTIDGGDGAPDTADYSGSDAAVTISLPDHTASGGHAEGDTLTDIEGLTGSAFDDFLTGGPVNNTFDGGGGNDDLQGGGGDDHLTGGDGDDFVNGDAGNDVLVGGAGNDALNGGDGSDIFVYTSADFGLSGDRDQITSDDADTFDLSAIDANAMTPEDDAFTIGTIGDEPAPGVLILQAVGGGGGSTRFDVTGYVDNDDMVDLAFHVSITGDLTEADFTL